MLPRHLRRTVVELPFSIFKKGQDFNSYSPLNPTSWPPRRIRDHSLSGSWSLLDIRNGLEGSKSTSSSGFPVAAGCLTGNQKGRGGKLSSGHPVATSLLVSQEGSKKSPSLSNYSVATRHQERLLLNWNFNSCPVPRSLLENLKPYVFGNVGVGCFPLLGSFFKSPAFGDRVLLTSYLYWRGQAAFSSLNPWIARHFHRSLLFQIFRPSKGSQVARRLTNVAAWFSFCRSWQFQVML